MFVKSMPWRRIKSEVGEDVDEVGSALCCIEGENRGRIDSRDVGKGWRVVILMEVIRNADESLSEKPTF